MLSKNLRHFEGITFLPYLKPCSVNILGEFHSSSVCNVEHFIRVDLHGTKTDWTTFTNKAGHKNPISCPSLTHNLSLLVTSSILKCANKYCSTLITVLHSKFSFASVHQKTHYTKKDDSAALLNCLFRCAFYTPSFKWQRTCDHCKSLLMICSSRTR